LPRPSFSSYRYCPSTRSTPWLYASDETLDLDEFVVPTDYSREPTSNPRRIMCSYIPGRNMRTRVHRRFSSRACRANRVYCGTLVSMSNLQIPALYRRRRGSSQNHNGSAGRSLSAYSGVSLAQKDYIEARSSQCLWQVFRVDVDHKTLIRVSICCIQSSRERLLALRSLQRSISSMTVFLGRHGSERATFASNANRAAQKSTRKKPVFKRFWQTCGRLIN
jgi:hypothetical protein